MWSRLARVLCDDLENINVPADATAGDKLHAIVTLRENRANAAVVSVLAAARTQYQTMIRNGAPTSVPAAAQMQDHTVVYNGALGSVPAATQMQDHNVVYNGDPGSVPALTQMQNHTVTYNGDLGSVPAAPQMQDQAAAYTGPPVAQMQHQGMNYLSADPAGPMQHQDMDYLSADPAGPIQYQGMDYFSADPAGPIQYQAMESTRPVAQMYGEDVESVHAASHDKMMQDQNMDASSSPVAAPMPEEGHHAGDFGSSFDVSVGGSVRGLMASPAAGLHVHQAPASAFTINQDVDYDDGSAAGTGSKSIVLFTSSPYYPC
jgi:hypothetical protein